MTENVRWLTLRMVQAFHQETLQRHGGSGGMRDDTLLESALARPRNRAAYDKDATLFDLAAEYGAGIVGNHPFVDGNKRTTIDAIASGDMPIDDLSAWFDRNCQPRP